MPLIQRALQLNDYELTFKHVETPAALRAILTGGDWDLIAGSAATLLLEENRRTTALNRIEHSIAATLNLPTVLSRLAQQTRECFDADESNIYLPDADERSLRMISARRGTTQIIESTGLPLEADIIRHVVRSGKSVFIPENGDETLAHSLPGTSQPPGTLICAPLMINNQIIGLMALTRYTSATPFTQTDLNLLSELAPQAAVAIRNAQLYSAEQQRTSELADALARQNELAQHKDQFIQNISHELRTPIAIARGYAELLDNGSLGDLQPDQQEPAAIVARRLRMLSSLVSDINTIFEVESQRRSFTDVDITALANNAVSDFKTLAKNAKITLTANITTAPLLVSGDPIQLRRALDNLMINALKFTPEGGSITVHLKKESANAVLEVIDTGVGIPEDKLGRIFERFYQVEVAMSRRHGGSGLGLSLVKQIVESHNGTIEVESAPGAGSTFKITLPLLTEASQSSLKPNHTTTRAGD